MSVVLVLLLVEPHLPIRVSGIRGHAGLFPLASTCAALWGGLRLRLPIAPWPRELLGEGAGAAMTGVVIGLPVACCAWLAAAGLGTAPGDLAARLVLPDGDSLTRLRSYHLALPAHYLAALLGLCVGLYLLVRLGARLWLAWDRLRRARLRWALTHAHLLLVGLGAVSLSVAVLLVNLRTPDVLADLAILVVVTALVLLAVLPPSALFSYLVTRDTSRRIEALATATEAFRHGDRDVRVPVEGEDEVARLQADFNAMAADLDQAMSDLQAERDTVTRLLQARRELVAGISHELRTPVAILRAYLESTRAHWQDTPPPTARDDIEVMEREVVRLQALIDDLFTLARADAARLEVRAAPTDVGDLARRSVAALRPLAWQSGKVEVLAEVVPATPPAWADAHRLEQVVSNLLHNAVRHTPPGGIVAVRVSAEPEAVALQVQDTGEGIAPAELPRIWERFYRSQGARTDGVGGAGLGLALVKELTEAMGGRVAVESTPGQGSCFTVRLPRVPCLPGGGPGTP
jgi:signal transduction histidine kinase